MDTQSQNGNRWWIVALVAALLLVCCICGPLLTLMAFGGGTLLPRTTTVNVNPVQPISPVQPIAPAVPPVVQPAVPPPASASWPNVLDQPAMKSWLHQNIGGDANQWHLVLDEQSKAFLAWEFDSRDGSGNAILCAKHGQVHFGVKNLSTNWWDAAIIRDGKCTYAELNKPDGTVAIDNARWYPR